VAVLHCSSKLIPPSARTQTRLVAPVAAAEAAEETAVPKTVVIIPLRRPILSTSGPIVNRTIAVPTLTKVDTRRASEVDQPKLSEIRGSRVPNKMKSNTATMPGIRQITVGKGLLRVAIDWKRSSLPEHAGGMPAGRRHGIVHEGSNHHDAHDEPGEGPRGAGKLAAPSLPIPDLLGNE